MARNVFPILIRRASYEVDERQRELSRLLGEEAKLQLKRAKLQADLVSAWELTEATQLMEIRRAMPDYHQSQKIFIAEVDQSLQILAEAIQQARDRLSEAFSELKKLETIHEQRQKAEAARQEQILVKEMDEIATQRAIRQEKPYEG